jgi:23S rRNA (cytosine1962-C5)-methyltransferase
MNQLYLKTNAHRRLQRGHPWVYSNEIDIERSPLKDLVAGSPTKVLSAEGKVLGSGFVSPGSLVSVRLLRRGPSELGDWMHSRLARALKFRERCFAEPYYRLVFAEGDGLPGLVVDRYDKVLVVQVTTWGMELQRAALREELQRLLPGVQVLFNDRSNARTLEGLPAGDASEMLEAGPTEVLENGTRLYLPPVAQSQKTGWFYDQRDNRAKARPFFAGARVLDLYSYVGGWGVQAAVAGAADVTCVDSSAAALEAATRSASALGVGLVTVQGLVEAFMDEAKGERWDLLVLDPPALIKRRRDIGKGTGKYRALTRAALALVAPGGVLVSCSCSVHLNADAHISMVRGAARAARRPLTVIGQGDMGLDHPSHPLLPDSRYLSCWYFRVD